MDTINIPGLRNHKRLTQASDSIKNVYLRRGFLNLLALKDSTSSKDTLIQRLFLGRPFTTIQIDTRVLDPRGELVLSSLSRKRNKYITPAQLEKELGRIQNEWNEKGQPFAKINSNEWDFTNQDTAKLRVTIKSESSRKIDRIIVNGYPNYPKNQIENLINPRSLYNSKNLDKIESQLSSLGYLEIIKPPEALFKKDSTLLYIYVKKKQVNSADGLIGFNTDADGKLELNGFLEASLLNNFNYGERIDFEYRNDTEDQSRLGVQVDLPAIIKKSTGITAGIQILRRDSIYQNTSLTLGANYQLPGNALFRLNYTNTKSTSTSSDLTTTLTPLKPVDYHSNGVLASYSMTVLRPDRLQPEQFQLAIQAGLQNRSIQESNSGQYVLGVQIKKLWKLPSRLYLLTAANSYLLKTSNLQFNELQQVGGTNTVRGFNQNSIDTAAYILVQNDLRYVINDQIYVNLLSDGGVFEDYIERNPQFLYAIGAGFGILTKAGTLRFEVANGRFSSAKQGISSTIAHLNLKLFF